MTLSASPVSVSYDGPQTVILAHRPTAIRLRHPSGYWPGEGGRPLIPGESLRLEISPSLGAVLEVQYAPRQWVTA